MGKIQTSSSINIVMICYGLNLKKDSFMIKIVINFKLYYPLLPTSSLLLELLLVVLVIAMEAVSESNEMDSTNRTIYVYGPTYSLRWF